ncbi:MAG: hypothetical protein ACLGIF_10680 [Actinomycetes bacterium]
MKTLLEEQFAPITSEIGFLRLPFPRAAAALESWRREQRPGLTVTSLAEPLDAALARLPPLAASVPRELLVEVRGGWCAYFDAAPDGTAAYEAVHHLARALHCDGLRVVVVPHGPRRPDDEAAARPGALRWELTYRTDWASETRAVAVQYHDAAWQFSESGRPQPYEETTAYRAKRVRDRFTSAMLERYCQALGLEVFDPAAYGPRGVLLEHKVRPSWRTRPRPLPEVQARLGIVPGAARDLPG